MTSLRDRIKRRRSSEAFDDQRRLQSRILPMAAFYGREPALEAERLRAYNDCAKAFRDWGEASWSMPGGDGEQTSAPADGLGFGGRGQDITAIERNRLIAINQNSAPFEWLAAKRRLETRDDPAGIGNARFSAGLKFRDILIGAEPSALKSFDLERSGGGGVPVMISDFKLDCVQMVTRVRATLATPKPSKLFRGKRVETELFGILERLIYKDEWILDGMSRRKEKAVMLRLHYGLDTIALLFGMITPQEFDARWNPQSKRPKEQGRHPLQKPESA